MPSSKNSYGFIDGIRGIAILMVVISHLVYMPVGGTLVQFIGAVFISGRLGVPIFFSLSGFLIALPFWKLKLQQDSRVMPKGYVGRRFYKIYPPLALSILFLTPIHFFLTKDTAYFEMAARWLIGLPFLGSWAGPISGTLNAVMWSLIVEVQFYLVLPLLFLALRSVSYNATLWILSLGLIVTPIFFDYWNHAHGIKFTIIPQMVIPFPTVLGGFALGVCIAGLHTAGRITEKWARLGDLGIILIAIAFPLSAWSDLKEISNYWLLLALSWFVKIAAACLLCYVAYPQNPRAKWLTQSWLCWFGAISYEWYLFHYPLIVWVRQWAGNCNGNIVKYALVLGVPLVAGLVLSAWCYKAISLPILKMGRSRHSGMPKQMEAPLTISNR